MGRSVTFNSASTCPGDRSLLTRSVGVAPCSCVRAPASTRKHVGIDRRRSTSFVDADGQGGRPPYDTEILQRLAWASTFVPSRKTTSIFSSASTRETTPKPNVLWSTTSFSANVWPTAYLEAR